MNFVPQDFIIPEKLETDLFIIRKITKDDAEKDYEAVMSSRQHLISLGDEGDTWPEENMTIEENIEDLERHEKDFKNRKAFVYTVMSLDETLCLGSVYIYPTKEKNFDAQIYYWTRMSEIKNGLEEYLFNVVKVWIREKWTFKAVVYPGREVK